MLSTGTPSLPAQERERSRPPPGPPILELVTSTRALGLGGAFWAAAGGSHAIFHHPALISGQGFEISGGGSTRRHGDRERDDDGREGDRGGSDEDDDRSGRYGTGDSFHLALSASGGWLGGNVAVGVAVFDHDAGFVVAERKREHMTEERDRGVVVEAYWPHATEFVGTVAYANEVFGFGVGAAAKVVGQRSGSSRARTVAFDVGVAREVGPASAVLTVRNLGRDMEVFGRHVPLPWQVAFGAGVGRRPVGPLDIGGSLHVTREGGGEIVPGGGIEVAYWPIVRRVLVARLGAARVVEGDGLPLTFGAGFEGDRVRFDYGYSDHDPRMGAHRIGISIR